MSVNQIVEPYLIALLQAVLVALGGIIINWLIKERKRITIWLNAHTTAKQHEILEKIAGNVYAYVETVFKDRGGKEKFNIAMDCAKRRIDSQNLGFKSEDIAGAIQKAWIQLDPKSRLGIATPEPITVTVEKPPAPEVQQLLDAAKSFASIQKPGTNDPNTTDPDPAAEQGSA